MRTLSGKYRRSLRIKQALSRPTALCRTLPDSGGMTARNLRTADYSDEARRRLGDAVAAARRAAGFRWRTDFARRHADVSVSSLKHIEQAKPLVGVIALHAIGQALAQHFPGAWTKDTPREILEGDSPPDLTAVASPTTAEVDTTEVPKSDYIASRIRPEIGSDEWLIKLASALDEEDYLEVRLLWVRYIRALRRIQELEQSLTERPIPQR